MEGYEDINIIKPITKFLQTCPFLDKYNIDLSAPSVQKLSTNDIDSSAVDYLGSTLIAKKADVINGVSMTRQANFDIYFFRKSGHDMYREEFANFAFNFEQWIDYCQINDLTPKISNSENGKYEEYMFADNGVFLANTEDPDNSVYVIQLHIVYKNEYIDTEY